MKNNFTNLHIITFIIIVLSAAASSIGVFYTSGGKAYDFINQYGDKIKIYGDGLYAHDSYSAAPLFRGADFTILFFVIPLLAAALVTDVKRKSLKSRLILTSLISVITYYSASIAFGVTYNVLHLLYIALFSASLFGLIMAAGGLNKKDVADKMSDKLPYRGFNIFLVLTGAALIAAWLPDILSSLAAGSSLSSIEVYTTSVTNVLDMGVVGPAALVCLFLLRKRSGMGYILLEALLTLCFAVGVMVPIQSAFQLNAGVELSLQIIITKAASFVVLGAFALYFNIRLLKNMK